MNQRERRPVNKRARARQMRVFGIIVMAVAAIALVVPVLLDTRWTGGGGAAAEPMQLTGAWLGMRLDATDSPIARQLGIPPVVKGVVVTDLLPTPGSRAALSGVTQSDVLVGVDGNPIGSLAELYALSTKLDTTKALKLDVLRQGRPIQLMLAARTDVTPQTADTTNAATYGVPVVAR